MSVVSSWNVMDHGASSPVRSASGSSGPVGVVSSGSGSSSVVVAVGSGSVVTVTGGVGLPSVEHPTNSRAEATRSEAVMRGL
jgi:hypothetical protein